MEGTDWRAEYVRVDKANEALRAEVEKAKFQVGLMQPLVDAAIDFSMEVLRKRGDMAMEAATVVLLNKVATYAAKSQPDAVKKCEVCDDLLPDGKCTC